MIKSEFKHLDALRGIMAMYVTLVHFYVLYTLNVTNTLEYEGLGLLAAVQLGQIFMTAFFVLSGFLITYILLIDKEKNGVVRFKRFYLRRAFRILPMYYLAVLGMYFLYRKACLNPDISSLELCSELTERARYYFFMIPNWAHAIDKNIPHISNFWSIGAEEQFYILWPIILYGTKKYLNTFYGVYVFYCLLLIGFVLVGNFYYHNQNETLTNIAKFLDYTRFGAFAFGGIIAYYFLHLEESRFQKTHLFLVKKSTQWVCLIVSFLIAVIPNQHVIFLKHIIVIPCCAVVIYNLAFDKNSILKLDQKQLNYLGKATYSLYVLNQIVIDFSIKICFGIHIKQPIAIFIISITALLICSFICYELIEKPFMKLRRYFN